MPDPCKEKTELLFAYSDATRTYCEAVTELHDKMGKIGVDEYHRLHRMGEEARLAVETARVALELHVGEHGC
jgi:hypothetical protein